MQAWWPSQASARTEEHQKGYVTATSLQPSQHRWLQVRAPHMRPHVLEGHDREVTAVAWCPSDPHRIATCGDDATVKLWSLQRQWPPAQKAASQVNVFLSSAVSLSRVSTVT